jgi:hypothetical protein
MAGPAAAIEHARPETMGQSEHPDLDPGSLVGLSAAEAKDVGIHHGVQVVRLIEVDGDQLLWVIGEDGDHEVFDLMIAHDRLNLHVTDGTVVAAGFEGSPS